ncbi:hypothetical protein AB0M36_08190 [Actinoplanes sp. NPDC051346]|uniref:hypothetical protein n=1 Tax=Actinoplanes sp. NPDC051346 TaxID=3155048 RepID=UPI0034312E97
MTIRPGGIRRPTVAIAVVATLLITGCRSPKPNPPGGAPPSTVVGDLTTSESDLLDRAEQLLIRDCMRRRGFEYTAVARPAHLQYRDFPHVVDDVEWARKHGYGTDLRRQQEMAVRTQPNTKRLNGMPEPARAAALSALNGVPGARTDLSAVLPSGVTTRRSADSCTSEAQRVLYGDLQTWYRVERVTENLADLRIHMVHRDARYQRGVTAWGRCMTDAGQPYDSPAQTLGAVLAADPPMPREREVALAVTEATCADRTGLTATAAELDRRYAQEVDARYAADIADRRRLRHDALPGARAIVLAS